MAGRLHYAGCLRRRPGHLCAGIERSAGGVGSVEVNAVNMDREVLSGLDKSNNLAVENQGWGSYSSYVLTNLRWIQQNPQIQLYYNSAGQPSNLDKDAVKSGISAAVNTWDNAVAQNLFADGTTVKDTIGANPSDNNVHIFGTLPSGILDRPPPTMIRW